MDSSRSPCQRPADAVPAASMSGEMHGEMITMIRRFLLSAVFVVAGFTAGLVLTGRLRSASDSRADVGQAPATSASRPAAQPSQTPQTSQASPTAVGGPDFTRIAAQSVKG